MRHQYGKLHREPPECKKLQPPLQRPYQAPKLACAMM
jgi:hypothetical protein